jgi:hypothetical protein
LQGEEARAKEGAPARMNATRAILCFANASRFAAASLAPAPPPLGRWCGCPKLMDSEMRTRWSPRFPPRQAVVAAGWVL